MENPGFLFVLRTIAKKGKFITKEQEKLLEFSFMAGLKAAEWNNSCFGCVYQEDVSCEEPNDVCLECKRFYPDMYKEAK